jgi:hypothetical protein
MEELIPTEKLSKVRLESLILDLKKPARSIVFAAIDTLVKNKEKNAIEPLRQLLLTADKIKVILYAGMALKLLNYSLTKNEEKLLNDSLIMSLKHQDFGTIIFGAKIFAQYFPEKSTIQLLQLVKNANQYNENKKRFEYSSEQLNELLDIIAKYGARDILESLIYDFAFDFSFSYSIDRMTKNPYDYSNKIKETDKFERTKSILQCIEELLKRVENKPDKKTIDKIINFHKIELIETEVTYIGDDSRDQANVVDAYYNKFIEILKGNNWI